MKIAKKFLVNGELIDSTWKDGAGNLFYPFLPWTPLALSMTGSHFFIVAISFTAFISSMNLLVIT